MIKVGKQYRIIDDKNKGNYHFDLVYTLESIENGHYNFWHRYDIGGAKGLHMPQFELNYLISHGKITPIRKMKTVFNFFAITIFIVVLLMLCYLCFAFTINQYDPTLWTRTERLLMVCIQNLIFWILLGLKLKGVK